MSVDSVESTKNALVLYSSGTGALAAAASQENAQATLPRRSQAKVERPSLYTHPISARTSSILGRASARTETAQPAVVEMHPSDSIPPGVLSYAKVQTLSAAQPGALLNRLG